MHLQRSHVECIALACSGRDHTVSEVTDRRTLRIEGVHLSGGIAVQHKFSAGHILLRALRSLGESFLGATVAVYNDARPRSGVYIAGLPGQREARNETTRYHPNQREVRS